LSLIARVPRRIEHGDYLSDPFSYSLLQTLILVAEMFVFPSSAGGERIYPAKWW